MTPYERLNLKDGSILSAKHIDHIEAGIASLVENGNNLENDVENLKSYVTPQMFGAAGDGMTDDTKAFQAAVDSGYNVHIPSGTYSIVGGISINKLGTSIVGQSKENTVLNMGSGISCNTSCIIKNIRINGTRDKSEYKTSCGILIASSGVTLENIYVYTCVSGIKLADQNHVGGLLFVRCTCSYNKHAGFDFSKNINSVQRNSIVLKMCTAVKNGVDPDTLTSAATPGTGYGFYIDGCYANVFIKCTAEYNTGAGFYFMNTTTPINSMSMMSCYTEQNKLAQYYFDAKDEFAYRNCTILSAFSSMPYPEPPNFLREYYIKQLRAYFRSSDSNILNGVDHEKFLGSNLMVAQDMRKAMEYTDEYYPGRKMIEYDGDICVKCTSSNTQLDTGPATSFTAKANTVYRFSYERKSANGNPPLITTQIRTSKGVLVGSVSSKKLTTEWVKHTLEFSVGEDTDMYIDGYLYVNSGEIPSDTEVYIKNFDLKEVTISSTKPENPSMGFVFNNTETGIKEYWDGEAWV